MMSSALGWQSEALEGAPSRRVLPKPSRASMGPSAGQAIEGEGKIRVRTSLEHNR
jgi:hypothetical protein